MTAARWTPGEIADLLERCEASVANTAHQLRPEPNCTYCKLQRDARALAAALREMGPHDHTWEDHNTETPIYLLPLKGKP